MALYKSVYYYYYYLFFDPGTQFLGNEKNYTMRYKNQAGMNLTPPPPYYYYYTSTTHPTGCRKHYVFDLSVHLCVCHSHMHCFNGRSTPEPGLADGSDDYLLYRFQREHWHDNWHRFLQRNNNYWIRHYTTTVATFTGKLLASVAVDNIRRFSDEHRNIWLCHFHLPTQTKHDTTTDND